MELIVDRFKQTADHTLGRLLLISGIRWRHPSGCPDSVYQFLCFTLEDVFRSVKVAGQTRIPAGRYEIKLRPEGGKYTKYLARFGLWQEPGMLHITNVPGFEWILMHPGATHKDTDGCLILGDGYLPEGTIAQSSVAYERVYKMIAARMLAGERVFITYEDNDR
jgi:hypothetical protein